MVSLVWGCELKGFLSKLYVPGLRSASYEAVNWKNTDKFEKEADTGQPRMRLWIERVPPDVAPRMVPVSLVWGCELKDIFITTWWHLPLVSLVWGCELKVYWPLGPSRIFMVSLVWGCELKGTSDWWCPVWIGSASYEAVNWKTVKKQQGKKWKRSASYEAVNWKNTDLKSIDEQKRSASYEAVNWKFWFMALIKCNHGQPRMRLWIERNNLTGKRG